MKNAAANKITAQMTSDLSQDSAAAVHACAIALVSGLPNVTEQEWQVALGFARDKIAAESIRDSSL